jgi:micrococcal nuclease
MSRSAWLAVALACALPACLWGQAPRQISGVVTHVSDGDTLAVRVGRSLYTIRLEGIDAPEGGQPFSPQARRRLRALAFGQQARVLVSDRDRYGRSVARVVVGGVDVGEEMVRSGLAWHYVRYSSDAKLSALEREARQARRGLWADPRAVPPWEYRRSRAGRRAP